MNMYQKQKSESLHLGIELKQAQRELRETQVKLNQVAHLFNLLCTEIELLGGDNSTFKDQLYDIIGDSDED